MIQSNTARLVLSSIANRRRSILPSRRVRSRCLSFSFAGPKKLEDILKKELVQDKSPIEISDLWYSYHESKVNVHGLVLKGVVAETIVSRAASCPFFVQPVFRDDGYFMLVSQFFDPSHFIMAYLEDYKMDPSMAQPLMTFSVFGDYAQSKDLTLVRADVLNFGIDDSEGLTIVKKMIDHYVDDDEYAVVKAFNKKPEVFDIDDYIGRQNMKWKETSKPADVIV